MSEPISEVMARVNRHMQTGRPMVEMADAVALAEAVEKMVAALRHAADTLNGCECEEAYDTLRDLGIPLTEDGVE